MGSFHLGVARLPTAKHPDRQLEFISRRVKHAARQLSMTPDQIPTPPNIIPLGGTRHAIQHRIHIHPRSQIPPRSHNHSQGQGQARRDLHIRYRQAGATPPNQVTGVSHQQDNVWVPLRDGQDSAALSPVGKPNHSSCVHHEKLFRHPHLCALKKGSDSFPTQ
jgi:hypothetical protein